MSLTMESSLTTRCLARRLRLRQSSEIPAKTSNITMPPATAPPMTAALAVVGASTITVAVGTVRWVVGDIDELNAVFNVEVHSPIPNTPHVKGGVRELDADVEDMVRDPEFILSSERNEAGWDALDACTISKAFTRPCRVALWKVSIVSDDRLPDKCG